MLSLRVFQEIWRHVANGMDSRGCSEGITNYRQWDRLKNMKAVFYKEDICSTFNPRPSATAYYNHHNLIISEM